MDLLASLNIHDLPEQQTRINSKIDAALKMNPDLRLGFDACLSCAAPLKLSDQKDTCCKTCSRVWYCSSECRKLDSEAVAISDDDQGLGHSSIICALLRLCSVDDNVEDPQTNESHPLSITKQEREESQRRITSEYESYPASLANVITDAPCFQPILERFTHRKRRGKTVRQEDIDNRLQSELSLTVHIIGSSHESELWGGFKMKHESCPDVFNAYAESLTDLVTSHTLLEKVTLVFFGPDCPKNDVNEIRYIRRAGKGANDDKCNDRHHNSNRHKRKDVDSGSCKVEIYSVCANYIDQVVKSYPSPDIICFFNPGFTCPDYDWKEALDVCVSKCGKKKVPFLVTTNTEMEAISDLGWLYQHGYIEFLPETVSDIINEGTHDHDGDALDYNDKHQMFFGENPNQGFRVRQSGNMANDLFVKNRWIYGGLLGTFQRSSISENSDTKPKEEFSSKTKRNSGLM